MTLARYWLFFALQLPLLARSQSLSITTNSSQAICVNSVLNLTFTTTGTFPLGNAFKAQVATSFNGPYSDLPGTFVSSPASVTLPATLQPTGNYYLRLAATSTQYVSAPVGSFIVAQPMTAQLTGSDFPDVPVNPYRTASLLVSVKGPGSYTLTFQDSSRYVAAYSNSYVTTTFVPVAPAQTTTYQLASIRNACGYGTVTADRVAVNVGSVGFTIRAEQGRLCKTQTVPLYYSTSAPLAQPPVFAAEMTLTANQTVALPISGTASPLQLQLPEGVPQTFTRIRVYDIKNNISAYVTYAGGESSFTISNRPVLTLEPWTGFQPDPAPGTELALAVNLTGQGMSSIGLSLGAGVQYLPGYEGGQIVRFTPTAPTSYSIASIEGACADVVQVRTSTIRVTPRPGLLIDSLSTTELCAGTPVRIFYTPTPGYTVPKAIKVQFGPYYTLDATTTRLGELFVAMPGSIPSAAINRLTVVDAANSTTIGTGAVSLMVKSRPQAFFASVTSTLPQPGAWSPYVGWSGGGQVTLRLASGERFDLPYEPTGSNSGLLLPDVFVSKTSTFSLVSAENECGVSPLSGTATVIVQTPTSLPASIYVFGRSLAPGRSCAGATYDASFYPAGTFGATNRFSVQLSDGTGNFANPTSTTLAGPGSFSITLPSQPGSYKIRVVSTDPILRSNEVDSWVSSQESTAHINLIQNGQTTVFNVGSVTTTAGQPLDLAYSMTGVPPFRYELLSGQRGIWYSFVESPIVRYAPTGTTVYGYRSVVDACGRRVSSPGALTAVVTPYTLDVGTLSQACVDQPTKLPFTAIGSLPAGGTYTVQVSEDSRTFTDLPTTGTSSPLVITLPKSMAAKRWYYRLAYQAGTTTLLSKTATTQLAALSVPDLKLSSPTGSSVVQLSSAGLANLALSVATPFLGGASLYLTTGQTDFYADGTSMKNIPVYAAGTYSVGLVQNACGYGKSSGTVRILERTLLNQLMVKPAICENEPVSVTYAVGDGAFTADTRFTVYARNLTSRAATLLAQTSSQTGVATLSAGLAAGTYSVEIVTAAPSLTLTREDLSFMVSQSIVAALSPRTQATYIGDQISLLITSASGMPYSVTLSTGQVIPIESSPLSIPLVVSQTTSYSIIRAANGCGVATVAGVVSISALPANQVTIRLFSVYSTFCTGKAVSAEVGLTGSFGADNVFTLLMSNGNGQNFQPIGTNSSLQSLTGLIAATTPVGGTYLFRINSSNPVHAGQTFGPVSIRNTPTGTLTGNTSIFKGDSTRISVALTGTPPWQFVLTDFFGPRTYTTSTSPFTLTVKPDTTIGYRLAEVRDSQCGVGTATGTALVTVTKLLATEPALPLLVRTWPNPTTGGLLLEGDVPGRGDVLVHLYNAAGTLVQQSVGPVRQGQLQHRIDLSSQPAGVYILTAEQDGRRSQFKVLKQ
ncbi:T9SS type A sorting domain-containing protein [uncultured Fibrella sp.]|uniref:T9SS type A sorting domain-containing protein n=1 Tax=uncultured Fibrella sp. TaxID=1284596 RepID=UPI0035C96A8F